MDHVVGAIDHRGRLRRLLGILQLSEEPDGKDLTGATDAPCNISQHALEILSSVRQRQTKKESLHRATTARIPKTSAHAGMNPACSKIATDRTEPDLVFTKLGITPRMREETPPEHPMKNHEIFDKGSYMFVGRTWCGKRINRIAENEPWTTVEYKAIAGNAENCGNCRIAKATNRAWGEPRPKKNGKQHEVQPGHEGEGLTWCARRVYRGGVAVPWSFESGQPATTGTHRCRVCDAAKAADERRQKKAADKRREPRPRNTRPPRT